MKTAFVTTLDDRFVPGFRVALNSLLRNPIHNQYLTNSTESGHITVILGLMYSLLHNTSKLYFLTAI